MKQENESQNQKPAHSDPTRAQKVMAGGDITQNVSHHSETNVINQDETKKVLTCFVTGRTAIVTEGAICRQCNEWALQEYVKSGTCRKCSDIESRERKDRYRKAFLGALTDDHMIDSEERAQLDQLAFELSLSKEIINSLELEIRNKEPLPEDFLSPRDKMVFNNAQKSVFRNTEVEDALSKLQGLAQGFPNNAEIAHLYVLAAIEADPQAGLDFLQSSPCYRSDSVIKSIRKIELHEKLNQLPEADMEERLAQRGFGENPLFLAKSLERLIDMYLDGEQEESQLELVMEESADWKPPLADENPYLHFVDAYLAYATNKKDILEPTIEVLEAEYYCQRKLRLKPEIIRESQETDAEKQFQTGLRFSNGDGVAHDYAEAVKWYRLSADQGHSVAQNNLGVCYENGQGVAQDHTEAVKWYRLSADQGHSVAQHNLGCCYHNGQGVAQNQVEAVKWYRLSADQGNPGAQNNLGSCLDNGLGVVQDHAEAVKWYRLSADQGNNHAQNSLGNCYFDGQGIALNHAEAVKWYGLSADQGNNFGQYNLGCCYHHGQGVVQDQAEAVKWYRLSAEQGNPGAQNNLGFCYHHGEGVAQNFTEAVKWYGLSADQGNELAKDNLEKIQSEAGNSQSFQKTSEQPSPLPEKSQESDPAGFIDDYNKRDQFCAEFLQQVREKLGELSDLHIGDTLSSSKHNGIIPRKKLSNLLQKSQAPVSEYPSIVALIDATVFGSGKNGMLFSARGNLYLHNDWTGTQSGAFRIPWGTVKDCELGVNPTSKDETLIGSFALNRAGCSLTAEQVILIVEIFRNLFKEHIQKNA